MLQNVASGSTGIWLDAAGYIYANNATSVVVTDTGRLGVGTTAPGYDLEVNGTARIDGNFTIGDASADTLTINAAALSSVSASTWDLVNSSAIALNIESGLMDFDTTNSRIGIGTTAPAGKLDVTDTSNTAASLSLTNNTAATIGAGANTLGVLDLQSTSLTTGNFLNIETNGLTSGKGINLTSTSTGLTTGSMLSVTASGNPGATWTGNLGLFEYITSTDADIDGSALKVGFTGAGAGDGTALNVTTAQTGTNALALRVNDDGTYTDSTPLVVDLNGNLGVGRTSPGMKLDVAGDIRAASGSDFYLGTIGFNDNASTSSGASLIGLFDNTYSNIAANTTVQGAIGELDSAIGTRAYTEDNYVVDSQSLTTSINALDMMLQNVASGSTGIWIDQGTYIYPVNYTSLVVTDTGRLGVGTTAPGTALEVVGEARTTRYAFQDDTDTYFDTIAANTIGFATGGTVQVAINANGNLGIGTTNPTSKLSIAGSSSTISNSSGNITITPASDLLISAGNVGIGVTSPSQKLHVVGSGRFTAVGSGTYSTPLNLTSDGTFTTSSSDITLKTNLEPVGSVLDKVLAIETYNFNWIDDTEGPKDVGFIAQEMAEIFPALAFTNPTDGKMGIRYNLMTTYLTKAIQEQQDIIMENASTYDLQIGGIYTDIQELTNDVYNLDTSDVQTTDELTIIKQDIAEIRAILENQGATQQTTESTQTTQSAFIDDPDGILATIVATYEEFKSFVSNLGMSATVDGELLVSSDAIFLGDTTLNNVAVTGNLTAGLISIDTLTNTIETIGSPCYNEQTGELDGELCQSQALNLQKNLAGNLNLFNGKVVITPDGTVNVAGAIKADKIQANEFSVNETSEKVGSGTLVAGSTFVVIENSNIATDSKIFVTPTSATGGQPLIVVAKVEGESFTVSIDTATDQDISFDWWILDISKEAQNEIF